MIALARPLTISRSAWGVARQLAGLESQHHVLHVPFVPLDGPEGEQHLRAALGELNQAGLAQGRQVHSWVVELLRLVSAPPVEFYGWIGLPDHTELSVVVASDGQSAVRAVTETGNMHLDPADPRHLTDSIVSMLPPCPPSRTSVTVPRDVYDATMGEQDQSARNAALRQLSENLRQDVQTLRHLLGSPRTGGCRFYAATRDRLGRKRASETPLTCLDLEAGRTTFTERPNNVGPPWLVVAPATAGSLSADLNAALRAVS